MADIGGDQALPHGFQILEPVGVRQAHAAELAATGVVALKTNVRLREGGVLRARAKDDGCCLSGDQA